MLSGLGNFVVGFNIQSTSSSSVSAKVRKKHLAKQALQLKPSCYYI